MVVISKKIMYSYGMLMSFFLFNSLLPVAPDLTEKIKKGVEQAKKSAEEAFEKGMQKATETVEAGAKKAAEVAQKAREVYEEHKARKAAPSAAVADLQALTIGDSKSFKYIPYGRITPGQLRYSRLNVGEKIMAAIKNNAAWWEVDKGWQYKFDRGNSLIETPLPVVLASFGPVLVDGHHDTLSNIALGGRTVPVFVMKDFSALTPEEFWKQATAEGLVYPYTLQNQYKIPQNFKDLRDDPNRFFAAIVARKCVKKDGKDVAIASPPTPLADYPVWIKFGNAIPFVEFLISDVMNKHGLLYDNAWGEKVSDDFVEKARSVLATNPIEVGGKKLKVIKSRIKFDAIPDICVPEESSKK